MCYNCYRRKDFLDGFYLDICALLPQYYGFEENKIRSMLMRDMHEIWVMKSDDWSEYWILIELKIDMIFIYLFIWIEWIE